MSSYESCVQRVLELLQPLARGNTITDSSDLAGDLGLSSLDVMEVVEQIEDEFDLSFPLNSLSDIRTVGDMARTIERLARA
jgi:acyl carrier protein